MKRLYTAPVDDQRCRVTIHPLTDGTTARCMKRIDQARCAACKQHRKMFREGKPLTDHITGKLLTSLVLR